MTLRFKLFVVWNYSNTDTWPNWRTKDKRYICLPALASQNMETAMC